jgi:hypothetical protein
MGLLFRILHRLYLIGSRIIQNSLINDPYYEYNALLVWLANFFRVIAILGSFGIVLYMLVWAVSLAIFLYALLISYLSAWSWEKFCKHFTSEEQEFYLIGSTVGYTVIVGTLIQIERMPWADGKTLFVYWTFLLILGFIIWRVTLFNVTTAGVKPVLAIKKIEYKQRFRLTKIPKEIPTENQAQAYLKKMK